MPPESGGILLFFPLAKAEHGFFIVFDLHAEKIFRHALMGRLLPAIIAAEAFPFFPAAAEITA